MHKQMQRICFALSMVLVLFGVLPIRAQQNTFGLSDDDFALWSEANANSARSDQFSLTFELTGSASDGVMAFEFDMTGSAAFDTEAGALQVIVDGDVTSGRARLPVEFETRIVDDNFYLRALDPDTGVDTGWIGESMDAVGDLFAQAFLTGFNSQGGSLDADGLADVLASFGAVDVTEFIGVERLDDDTTGQALFEIEADVGAIIGADAVVDVLLDLIERSGFGAVPEDATPGMMGAAFEVLFSDTTLTVAQTIDTDTALVTQTVVAFDMLLEASVFDAGENDITVQAMFIMDFGDDGAAPMVSIEAPGDAIMGFMSIPNVQVPPTAQPTEQATATPEPSVETNASVVIEADEPTEIAFDGEPVVLTYQALSDETVTIMARSVEGELDTTLELLDAAGEQVAFNDDHDSDRAELERFDSLIDSVELSPGTYTLVVSTFSGTGEGIIEVTIENQASAPEPTAAPEVPTDDEAAEAIIAASVDDNGTFEYEFEGAAGDVVTVTARATDNSLDTVLAVLDSTGEVIAENDDHDTDDPALGRYDSRIEALRLPDDGAYTVTVRGFAGSGGEFELIIARAGDSGETEAPEADITSDTITDSLDVGDVFVRELEVNAGDMYTITVNALSEDLDPVVGIYDSEGALITNNDDHGGADSTLSFLDSRIERYIFTQSGTVTIEVSGYRDTFGEFKLTIERVATDAPTDAGSDELLTGEIDANDTVEKRIDVQAGDYVTITLRSLSENFDPFLELISLDGDVLAINDDHGGTDGTLGFYDARIRNYPVTEDGTLIVLVSSMNSGGTFALTINIKN